MQCSRIRWAGACALAAVATPCAAQEFELIAHDYSARPESEVSSEPASAAWKAAIHIADPPRSFRESLYLPMIREAEVRYELPPRLLQALIWAESRFDPLAISPAGAAGLAQLMPATARELGVANRHDPAQSIDGGARYLRQMLDRFGAIHLALAAYNAGPGAVARAGGIPRNRETPGYVRNVLSRWSSYQPL